jgi:hypothetical protein
MTPTLMRPRSGKPLNQLQDFRLSCFRLYVALSEGGFSSVSADQPAHPRRRRSPEVFKSSAEECSVSGEHLSDRRERERAIVRAARAMIIRAVSYIAVSLSAPSGS